MNNEVLLNLGLSPEEAEIYLSLLNNGPQTAIGLGKSTKVKRTYVYRIATDLIKKGLVNQSKRNKTTIFAPLSPDHLLSLAEERKQKAQAAERSLEGVLTQLKEKYVSIDEKPMVTTYEGVSGLKKIYNDMISEGKEILAMLQTSEVEPELRDWLKSVFVPKRAEAGINAKVILASGKLAEEYQSRNDQALREVREVPKDRFPFPHEVDVYGDKIAFIHYKKSEPLIGILIYHPSMAKTMRAWFELAWVGASKY